MRSFQNVLTKWTTMAEISMLDFSVNVKHHFKKVV